MPRSISESTSATASAPAYVPFNTFEGFIETLHHTALPDHIDKTLMSKLSGGLQSHLFTSMKFLSLVGPVGETRDNLRKLVSAYATPAWKATLAAVITAAYANILGDLNIKTASAKALRDKFRDKGSVDGATLDKSVRFFVKALKSAGIEYSPHLSARKSYTKRSVNGRARVNAGTAGAKEDHGHDDGDPASPPHHDVPGTIRIPIYLPNKPTGMLVVPEELTKADCAMISAILDAYATRRCEKDE